MTTRTFSTCARIVLLAATAGALSACAPVRDHHHDAPRHAPSIVQLDYWYYPAIGSYYDPRARIYIYFEQGRWLRASVLPARVRAFRGNHVVVRARHDRPYDEHLAHRKQYAPDRYIVRPRDTGRSRQNAPDRRDNDVWLGSPRQPQPQPRSDQNRRDQRDGRSQESQNHSEDRSRARSSREKDAAQSREVPRSTRSSEPKDKRRAPAAVQERTRGQTNEARRTNKDTRTEQRQTSEDYVDRAERRTEWGRHYQDSR